MRAHTLVAALLLGWTAQPANAYPIDCAILLCMAGGFPASTECAAAKIEVIRRITPWPVEPPLQLWRCPMRINAATAARIGLTQDLGPDGLTAEVRQYRDAIEIYHIQAYARIRSKDGAERVIDATQVGQYQADGEFIWGRSSFERGPAWLAKAVDGHRVDIRECVRRHRNDSCREYRIIRTENRASRIGFGRLRGVALRYEDHEGAQHTEFVKY